MFLNIHTDIYIYIYIHVLTRFEDIASKLPSQSWLHPQKVQTRSKMLPSSQTENTWVVRHNPTPYTLMQP